MTYRELSEQIAGMPEDRKDDDLSVYFRGNDEFYPVDHCEINELDDVLDAGHWFMVI